jgi:hypothetical protein
MQAREKAGQFAGVAESHYALETKFSSSKSYGRGQVRRAAGGYGTIDRHDDGIKQVAAPPIDAGLIAGTRLCGWAFRTWV